MDAAALQDFVGVDPVGLHGVDVASHADQRVGPAPRPRGQRVGLSLWEAVPVQAALVNRHGVVVSTNRAWRQYGHEGCRRLAAAPGANYLDACAQAAADGVPEAYEAARLVRAALAGHEPERRAVVPCGDGRWLSVQVAPAPGRLSGALIVHSDITRQRETEDEWRYRALHDPLTGLPNRALLDDRLQHAIAGASRDPRSLAVLFVDLDAFKSVNDRLGHAAGDRVLCEVARRMAGSVRDADTIGRWGGDEFLVIAERLDLTTTADDVAARLAASVDAPVLVGTDELSISVTVGVAHLDRYGTADQLVQAADDAVRRARAARPERASR